MRKYLFFSIFLIFCFVNQNNDLSATLQNKIIAKVGSQFISSFELKNKIKTILFLTNQQVNQKSINDTKREALESLINTKLKKVEVLKYGLTDDFNKGVNKYFKNLADKYNTNNIGLKEMFIVNNVNYEIFSEEIKTELAWQKIIYNIYKNKININKSEIEEDLKSAIKNNQSIVSYKLSEIEIIVNDASVIEKKIQEIKTQIEVIGFENTAVKFSSSSSSFEGGNLGWINSNSLSKQIYNVVRKLKKGGVTKPLILGNTLLFIKLIDKKETSNKIKNIDEIKKEIESAKKNDLLNLYSNSHLSKIRNNALIEIK